MDDLWLDGWISGRYIFYLLMVTYAQELSKKHILTLYWPLTNLVSAENDFKKQNFDLLMGFLLTLDDYS